MGEIISVMIKTQLSFTSSDIFTTTVNYENKPGKSLQKFT